MRLTVGEARALVERVLTMIGYQPSDAPLIADHLIDCELRGLNHAGLARVLSIAERIDRIGRRDKSMRIEKETPVSARIDGGDGIGYIVAYRATEIAVATALASGIAIVGANNTWYTGMLSYYAEMAARQGLVSIIASNTSPWVAPHGACEARYGTNPICFGFPSATDPVICDIGTSAVIHAEVTLAGRLGHQLPEGVAFDPNGEPTQSPAAALDGAFAPWASHKGSGLGMVVQLLGVLAGSAFAPPNLAEFGFLIVTIRPDLLTPADAFASSVADYANWVRTARPVDASVPVRMPFDRSRQDRQRRLAEDAVEVDDVVHAGLVAIADRLPAGGG